MTNGTYAELKKIEYSQVVLIVIYDFPIYLVGTYGAKYVELAVNLPKQLCVIASHQVNKLSI
jgi:hypothetical protein